MLTTKLPFWPYLIYLLIRGWGGRYYLESFLPPCGFCRLNSGHPSYLLNHLSGLALSAHRGIITSSVLCRLIVSHSDSGHQLKLFIHLLLPPAPFSSEVLFSLGLSGCKLETLETTLHSVISSPKDSSGGEPSTSEEEPTFDPGYEPDWAVISTVRPRPHLTEPRRGR